MITARPFYFGKNQELFGWYHAPDASYRDLGVVIVSPNGYEMLSMHWGWRRCAERFADAGIPALRFDLHGTGDSLGDDQQPDRVAAWLTSIGDAIDALKLHSGVTRVVLLGTRLGATLAATVTGTREDVAGVVLYVPCTSGRTYVREIKALAATARVTSTDNEFESDNSDNGNDVLMAGWLLTEQTVNDLSKLDLSKQSFPGKQVLYLSRKDGMADQRLLQALQTSAASVTIEEAADYAVFAQDALFAQEPDADFRSIETWVRTLANQYAVVSSQAAAFPQVLQGTDFTEQPVIFGVERSLFGVLCMPRMKEPKSCLVFINTAANHHVGAHRLTVTLARELVTHGIASLRMDVGGIGDSPERSERVANRVYYPATADDVIAAVDELIARGLTNITLTGICSGAYLAYYAAIKGARIQSLVLVNLQRFIWREGDSLEFAVRTAVPSMGTYLRRALQIGTWKRALTGGVDLRFIIPTLTRKTLKKASGKFTQIANRLTGSGADENEVSENCKILLQQGVRIRMIYSGNDGGLDEVAMYLGTNASVLANQSGFEFNIVADVDHTFTASRAIKKILEQYLH